MQGKSVAVWRGALPANIEPAAAFVQRADRWWTQHVVRRAAAAPARAGDGLGGGGSAEEDAGQAILVVSHGGLLRVLVQNLIESRRVAAGSGVDVGRYRFPNASVTVIEVEEDGKGTLVLFADTTHLDVELVEGNADIVEP